MPDPTAVRSMFARIAGRYDLANRILSGGLDIHWRRALTRSVYDSHPRQVLDVATGSGDVAFALADRLPPGCRITGVDFCPPMLEVATRRRSGSLRWGRIEFRAGDGMALPFPPGEFDAVTIAFGLRNMADRHKSLTEMRRVLRPGGRLFVLEFSQPHLWFRPVYYCYLQQISPRLAGLITGDRSAYEYLRSSIEQYPNRSAMTAEILRAGFAAVTARPMTFGIVALHVARSVE